MEDLFMDDDFIDDSYDIDSICLNCGKETVIPKKFFKNYLC